PAPPTTGRTGSGAGGAHPAAARPSDRTTRALVRLIDRFPPETKVRPRPRNNLHKLPVLSGVPDSAHTLRRPRLPPLLPVPGAGLEPGEQGESPSGGDAEMEAAKSEVRIENSVTNLAPVSIIGVDSSRYPVREIGAGW